MRSHVVHTIEDALKRMGAMLGRIPTWTRLEAFLPAALGSIEERRSAIAATLSASLELCRRGEISLRQGETFGPIYLQPRAADGAAPTQ
jgi:segregation and condensation protein A